MILLVGASGYVGHAFARELHRRRSSFIPLTRTALDYTSFDLLFDYVQKMKPEFIINAAGYAPNPNVDSCELAQEEVLCANALLPQTIARVCLMTDTPWGHVSSGSIYVGAKVAAEWGRMRIERDLNHPELRRLFAGHPEKVQGFTEWDEPNFSFRHAPCNFYSGTKALAEEAIRGVGLSYIWRPRMLFNECDETRNLLSKLQHYARVYDNVNSISHLDEFVRACLELWERQAPFGIYNVVNPGAITTRRIVEMIQRILKPDRRFEFWKNDEEFYRCQAKTPRSNCILDASKLLSLGVRMRPVEEALEDALERWQTASPSAEFAGAGVL
ncbi:MAG: sugar nucleotide-binding protein [Verrucomicrobiota bacterium]|jgi:UDP-glucose 4,6-dehydratase